MMMKSVEGQDRGETWYSVEHGLRTENSRRVRLKRGDSGPSCVLKTEGEKSMIAELVRRAQNGDADAYTELVRRFQDAVFATAY